MPPIRFALLCAVLPFALCACAGLHAAAPQTVTLAPGQHADIGSGDTLTYDSYSDSRCPISVRCVWAGQLAYRFTVATPRDRESFSVTLPNTSHVSTALGGARIALDAAGVPPARLEGGSPAQYSVTLTVSRP